MHSYLVTAMQPGGIGLAEHLLVVDAPEQDSYDGIFIKLFS